MNHTIFIHPPVSPKTVQIDVLDEPRLIAAVYEETEVDGELVSTLVTAERWAEPSTHKEDVLNIPAAPVYPATFGKLAWRTRQMDVYSDNPSHRAELWEDTEGTATYAEIVAVFPELPRYVEIAARNWGSAQLRELTTPYEELERGTWHNQQREAEAWLVDNTAEVPMITAQAITRGVTIEDLVGKITGNVTLFRQAAGIILGKQQRPIDQAYNAASLADLLAVSESIDIDLMSV